MINRVKIYQCDLCVSSTQEADKYLNRWVVLPSGKVVCPACAELISARTIDANTSRLRKSTVMDKGIGS